MTLNELLVHRMKSVHMERLINIFKAIIKHGLKISPKKCQLFKTNLIYLGNVFHTKDKKMTIRPITTGIEVIKNCPPPKSTKECKSFCGVVNYLSSFCPNLQKLLKPIDEITRKGIPIRLHRVQNEAFLKRKKLTNKTSQITLSNLWW